MASRYGIFHPSMGRGKFQIQFVMAESASTFPGSGCYTYVTRDSGLIPMPCSDIDSSPKLIV